MSRPESMVSEDEIRTSNDLLTQISLELGGTALDKLQNKEEGVPRNDKTRKNLILQSSSKTSEQCRYYMSRHIERMSTSLDKVQEKMGLAILLSTTRNSTDDGYMGHLEKVEEYQEEEIE